MARGRTNISALRRLEELVQSPSLNGRGSNIGGRISVDSASNEFGAILRAHRVLSDDYVA